MQNYGISNELSNYQLKEKLKECVEGIIFTPGSKRNPTNVHSKDAAAKAVYDNSLFSIQITFKIVVICNRLESQ